MKPFSEDTRFEQGNNDDPFYATGSIASIGETPGSFSRDLFNKEQIKVNFSVKSKTSMLPNSSSVYYFNISTGQWSIPSNSLKDHVGPFGNVSISDGATNGSTFIEDFIGFDYSGNSFVSGNLNIIRSDTSFSGRTQKLQTNRGFSQNIFSRSESSQWLVEDFPKTLTRNSDYDASAEQTFTIPIDKPFLIEKIVIEIPFCFGDSWFRDMSGINYAYSSGNSAQYTLTLNSAPLIGQKANLIDQGGPAITVSLMSQKKFGSDSIRDIIGKNLISHISDSVGTNVNLTKHSMNNFWYLSPGGLDADLVNTVVDYTTVNSKRVFTGSLINKITPKVSNGVGLICLNNIVDFSPTIEKMVQFAKEQLSNEFIGAKNFVLSGVDAFGRGLTGFAPSGGSIFGGEYVTAGLDVQNEKGDIKNQLFISDDTLRQQKLSEIESKFTGNVTNIVGSLSNIFIGSSKDSPYLLNPGEKLVLVVSKTRPTLKEMKIDINTVANPDAELTGRGTLLSSSYFNDIKNSQGHDAQFNTGSINITFYGSYVRAGNSYIP